MPARAVTLEEATNRVVNVMRCHPASAATLIRKLAADGIIELAREEAFLCEPRPTPLLSRDQVVARFMELWHAMGTEGAMRAMIEELVASGALQVADLVDHLEDYLVAATRKTKSLCYAKREDVARVAAELRTVFNITAKAKE